MLPLIVQSDRTILLDVHAEGAEEARAAILPFAELEKSPEHIHTYRISPLSLWNAASAGLSPSDVASALSRYSRYEAPAGILQSFTDTMARFGKIRLKATAIDGELFLSCADASITAEIDAQRPLRKYLRQADGGFVLRLEDRGTVKWQLVKLGWPVLDEAPLRAGEPLSLALREGAAVSGRPFVVRDYQREAVRSVAGDGGPGTGYGVVALPCGAGKTIVGITFIEALQTNTLILTANTAALHQWIEELLDKTTLRRDQIAEYSGDSKAVAPVTIATYQILTWRPRVSGDADKDDVRAYPHFELFRKRPWGLIIYDEVQLLPAPVFRVTAELQSMRRLGLTATLVREDKAEDAVFSLVGPKRYDVPWRELEQKGWIAAACCREIRLDLPSDLKIPYAVAEKREKYRIASENPLKETVALQLIENHPEDFILVIGQYISQLEKLASLLNAPLVTGKTPTKKREEIYSAFKKGDTRVIVVSKVANFAIDLPDASMAIQVSGSFGSRQEEAQRLGRILRPKERNSYFYSLVSSYTVEEDFASARQKFLAEQGYKYSIQHWEE
jgi:DNA excision repair protein ERCC-3